MPHHRDRVLAVVALACLVPGITLAQSTVTEREADTAGSRPSVGLALGGGGARGFAHIGVLERLDELRIPVDHVAGTSMGAVVGVLFCLGFTPQEIDEDVLGVDWRRLMTDRPDRSGLAYRRKSDDLENIWPFEFGITEDGLRLQRGLVFGQKFSFTLRAPDLYIVGQRSFDELPIPYRAVATDLVTGEIVVPDRGDLLQAVRASMAAPGAFPPVETDDGRNLVDGYLRMMLPTEVVRDMGADVVIAVHPGWSPGQTPPDTVWDLPSILMQSNYILTWANTAPDLAAADIPIEVPLADMPLHDLTQAERAIAAGREAVDAHLDALRGLSLPPDEYARWRASVSRRDLRPPVIDVISLDNPTRVDDRTIAMRLTQAAGDTLDLDRLALDLGRVYALGVFESVSYSLREGRAGTELTIEPVEKPYLPWLLHVGASWQVFFKDQPRFQFLARIDRLEMNGLGGELRAQLAVGRNSGVGIEWYQPLEYSRTFFVAPALSAEHRREGVFDGSYRLATYAVEEWGGRLAAGTNLGRLGELRAGWWLGRATSELYAGEADLPPASDDVGALELRLGIDRLDDHAVPHRGFALHGVTWLARPYLGDDRDFTRYWGDLIGAASAGDWTFQFRVEAGGSEGAMPYYREYRRGGLRRLTGHVDGSLAGDAFGIAGAGVLHHVGGVRLPYTTQWYLGAWVDAGNVWDRPEDMRLDGAELGGAITLLAETALGPLEFGYGRSSDGRGTVYLQGGVHFAQPFRR